MIHDLALLLSLSLPLAAAPATMEGKESPPVVIVLVDALRADRLAALGGLGRATPHLDRFARTEAVAYSDAISVSSWTKPTVPSLMTGLYPCQHGVHRGDTRPRSGDGGGKLHADILPDEAVTLAEAFRSAGYRTGAIVENAQISARFGMAQGFETYSEGAGDAAAIREKTVAWLKTVAPSDPYFLYVHFLDIHWPLRPRAEDLARFPLEAGGAIDLLAPDWRTLHEKLAAGEIAANAVDARNAAALYDACLLAVDREFQSILEAVRSRPGGERAIVVVTADHGESLLESGTLGHGQSLAEELLRIPLLVAGPGLPKGEVRTDPVSLVDVAPTVLDLASVDGPANLPGLSLRKKAPADRLRLAEQRVGAVYRLALFDGRFRYERSVRKASPGNARDRDEDEKRRTTAAFAAGARVKVAVTAATEGALAAFKVRLLEAGDDDLEIEAPLESIDAGPRTLRVLGIPVLFGEKEAAKSAARGLLGLDAYESLRAGEIVKVEGERLESGSIRAKKLERKPDSDLSPGGGEGEIEGIVASPSPELTDSGVPVSFTVGGFPIRCGDETRFRSDVKAVGAGDAVVVVPLEDGPSLEEARIGDGPTDGVTATERLHDRTSDPLLKTDLATSDARRLASMRERLDALLRVLERRSLRAAPQVEVDEKTMEELRRLGYVK